MAARAKCECAPFWTRSTEGCRLSDLMAAFFSAPWPWYIAGPLIGLLVPALLIVGNRMFGVSSSLRHMCSALLPGRVEHFCYDWKRTGLWNLIFVVGIGVGGFLASLWGGPHSVGISEQTRLALVGLGMHDFSGLAPRGVHVVRTAYTERNSLGRSGRFSRRLRHGLCRRVYFRSCDLRSCGPAVTVVDRRRGLLCRRSVGNTFYSSAD